MKVAFVKQQPDIFGPWESVLFGDKDKLLSVWPGKASYLEFTFLMEADWYVTNQLTYTEYTHNIIHYCPGFLETSKKYTRTIPLDKIPFDAYDLVVSFDPLPKISRPGKTVFAYFVHEHWDGSYSKSLTKPLLEYDLFLAHNDSAIKPLRSLPSSVPFPYPKDPIKSRSYFRGWEKADKVYLDWRTITALISPDQHMWNDEAHKLLKKTEEDLGIPCEIDWEFGTSFYGFADPPRWGDAGKYLRKIGNARYYISIGRKSGAGQGLCDAASLGCICIGFDRIYHQIICHPDCLCKNLSEAKAVLDNLKKSRSYREEILDYQNERLFEYFVDYPRNIFQKAIELKCS